METTNNENKTRRIDLDGNTLFHRKNQDGTVTLYCNGAWAKAMPQFVENSPNLFNMVTDPEDGEPIMVIVDPENVSLTVHLGTGSFGFTVSDPCEEDCEACENRDTCGISLAKKEESANE